VGDRITVFGRGPIGLSVDAGAKAAGARDVYVRGLLAPQLEAAEALGADVTIDTTEEPLRN
jgi:threonine dehydrogenase-like Zn-dependent dehydrogenase